MANRLDRIDGLSPTDVRQGMVELVFVLIGVLTVTLLVSCVFSIPTLFTYRIWETASSRTLLHLLSAAYTSVWGMIYIGGFKYLTDPSTAAVLWFGAFWLLSLTVITYVSPSNRKKLYISTCIGRFAILGIFQIIILTFKGNSLNRVYAEFSLLALCMLLAGLYFLKSVQKGGKPTG